MRLHLTSFPIGTNLFTSQHAILEIWYRQCNCSGYDCQRACRQWHGCLLGISISRFPTTSRRGWIAPARQYLLPRYTIAPGGPNLLLLQLEELLKLRHRILGPRDRVPDRPGVLVDLVVVAALERLVAEEVDRRVGDAPRLLGLGLEVLQAVGLVPAGGEDVEGDLAADGEAVWGEDGQSMASPFQLGRNGKCR